MEKKEVEVAEWVGGGRVKKRGGRGWVRVLQ